MNGGGSGGLLIVGTGRFAVAMGTEFHRQCPDVPMTFAGRNAMRLKSILPGVRVTGEPARRDARSTVEGVVIDEIRTADIDRIGPDVVCVCRSAYSPPGVGAGSLSGELNTLVSEVGFGLTTLLQLPTAVQVGRATTDSRCRPLLLNACYPDVVNAILLRLGIDIAAGVGNVLTMAQLATPHAGDVATASMVAHHAHLKGDPSVEPGPTMWRDGQPVPPSEIGALMMRLHDEPRERLNGRGGLAAGRLVAAMLTGRDAVATSLPGPAGLPGGYPVVCEGTQVRLDDRYLNLAELERAVAQNNAWSQREGVTVEDDAIVFHGTVAHYLTTTAAVLGDRHLPIRSWADGYARLAGHLRAMRPAQPAPTSTPEGAST